MRDLVVAERGFVCECCGKPVVLRKAEAEASGEDVAHVDHIKSIAEAPELRLVRSNLRVLAESCHNRRTIYDQGVHKGTERRASSACDVNGWPIDPKHGWNDGKE